MNPVLRRVVTALAGSPRARPAGTPRTGSAKPPSPKPASSRPRGSMKPSWRAPGLRLRLIDAVALAAGGLLVLKLVSLAGESGSAGRSEFARVLSHARTGYEPADPPVTGSVAAKEKEAAKDSREAAEPTPRTPGKPGPESAERAILEKLGARRDALQQRNRDLDTREQLIESAERKLESRVNDLRAQEEKQDGGAARRAEAEAAGLKAIVTMYETMKPKEAARVFDRLNLDVLVPVVVAMNPRKMAEVLAMMQPETAEKLTVALALRARGGPPPRPMPVGVPPLPPNELPAIDPPAR